MKRRIWIVTRRAGYNYGSSLQATAMLKLIASLGYDACILAYDEYSRSIRWRLKPLILDICYWFFSLQGRLRLRGCFRTLAARHRQICNFKTYEARWLNLSPKTLRTARQIEQTISPGDTCVCGSDQIWNPTDFDPIMFLGFGADKNIRKIAYAPSFGVSTLSAFRSEIKRLIQAFSHISVREDAGREIIKDLIGQDVPVVLDPTLLISVEEWRQIARTGNERRNSYMLCYFLGKDRIPHNFISMLSKIHSLEVVNIVTHRTRNAIQGCIVDEASPADFLALIDGADYVCTDSFHASIFSILFRKEFYTFERFAEGPQSQNSRLKTLFNKLGLTDRIVSKDATILPDRPINHGDVKARLAKEKCESIAFIRNALAS